MKENSPTRALRAVLANPYAQTTYTNAYSPHFIQMYVPSGAGGWPLTNAQGYTLSSTYIPGKSRDRTEIQPNNLTDGARSEKSQAKNRTSKPSHQLSPSNYHWYQSGDLKCNYKDCRFTGSQKSVETHKMDRHLIYPPGWEHRRRKAEWDADPSLKGCVSGIRTVQFNPVPEVLATERSSPFRARTSL